MSRDTVVWGVHMGGHVSDRPVESGYVAIGWQELGDLRSIPADREAFKVALRKSVRDVKDGAVPVHAGLLFRFVHEIQSGDIVVYPSKHNRMVNIGRFTAETSYAPDNPDEYPNRRTVEWLGHFPRTEFSQSALNEIGSFITLFRVRVHAAEFLAKVNLGPAPNQIEARPETQEDAADDDTATEAVARQAEGTTSDFVIRRIMTGMSGHEFEHFVAHILECMGYTTRVTTKSGDGGVDVIAHMDALGFQPPIVKVQCKRRTEQTPRPEVDQLLGTLGEGEYGLYVNLGSYARGAIELERNRAKLRLIDGEQFVEMLLENYDKLSPRYRSLIPLKQIYVPDLSNS
ncbi:MAG: restriction endonuclease [Verrucomicrobia bacterium]|nr:restriction endonuclease [Verrucomicrobiota bacterium]